jgi:F1F0 ATPase subunit 2
MKPSGRSRRRTMSEAVTLVLAGGAGLLLGAAFFGGLWYTVRRGVPSKRPALWFLGSLLLRTSLVLAGFYFVAGDHWSRLLASLLGFIIARSVATRLAGPPVAPNIHPVESAGHAP